MGGVSRGFADHCHMQTARSQALEIEKCTDQPENMTAHSPKRIITIGCAHRSRGPGTVLYSTSVCISSVGSSSLPTQAAEVSGDLP